MPFHIILWSARLLTSQQSVFIHTHLCHLRTSTKSSREEAGEGSAQHLRTASAQDKGLGPKRERSHTHCAIGRCVSTTVLLLHLLCLFFDFFLLLQILKKINSVGFSTGDSLKGQLQHETSAVSLEMLSDVFPPTTLSRLRLFKT